MGGLVAACTTSEVWLIHRRPEHVQAIRHAGLAISRDGEITVAHPFASLDGSEAGTVDVVLLTVKAYDTAAGCVVARRVMGPDSLAVTFQNGLGNLEIMAAELGSDRTVLGVTYNGATLEGPGRVADKGRGPTYIAVRPDTRERLAPLAAAFNCAGMPTELMDGAAVNGLLWGKLCMVSGINPLAAVLRVPNGALGQVSAARQLSMDAIAETMAVAAAKGIRLPFDPMERFDATTRATATMCSGTLLDAMRGRRTEIDAISGAIADEGDRLGVAVPVQRMLWRLVKAVEATHEYRVG
jgi:2-dehydropantoate 2-reductase